MLSAVKMLRKSLLSVGLRADRQPPKAPRGATAVPDPLGHGDIRRRDASTSSSGSTTVMGASSKMKTLDDLGGPNFMTSLYWLFVKGYFQKTQQMQVSVNRRPKK